MFFAQKHLGIDIGSSAVRMVLTKKHGSGQELQEYLIAPLPVGAVSNGSVLNVDAVALAIQEALRKNKVTVQNAVLSIDSQNVVIRHLKFPKMKEEELAEALKWDLEQYIPMSASDAVVDFEIVNLEEEDGVQQMDVMLVVVPKKNVQGYVDAVVKAGLKPQAVDIEPLAISRVLLQNCKDHNPVDSLNAGTVILVDMGSGSTKVAFFRNGKLILNRIVNIGGYDMTKAVATRLRVALDQAEQAKKEYGLCGIDKVLNKQSDVAASLEETEENEIGISSSGYELDVAEELRPKIESVIGELRRSIDFYRMQFRQDNVNRIFLVGGCACLKGLAQYLEGQLGTKVEVFNPINNIHYKGKGRRDNINEIAPCLTTAIGLAIREVKKV